MEPKFQNSFIPKKPVATSFLEKKPVADMSVSFDVLGYAASVFFVVVMLSWGGLFGYTTYLTQKSAAESKQIDQAQAAFEPDTIAQLLRLNARMSASKNILSNHLAPSQLFDLLQSLTIRHVRIVNFTYDSTDGSPTITADLEAQSYNALANQAQIFSQNSFITSVTYDAFALSDSGTVTTKIKAKILPDLLSYARMTNQSTSLRTP